jgi:DNA-binding SARP family transcriptional activator
MQFRILGPLEVVADETAIPLGPEKQRALLAVLLLNANRIVSQQRIIEELWDLAPSTAPKAIQTHVSRLRKILPEGSLKTRPPGYVLELAPGQLDLERFEQLRDEGRAALASDDPELAAARLAEALSLWRGPALAEFASEPLSRSEGARLEELHLGTLEEQIEASLVLGKHAELVGQLEALVARYPLRERLRGQLMLALYRSGRQAEALAAYQDGRRTLVEELGLEPSRALQDLERAILRHDSTLDTLPDAARRSAERAQLHREDVAPVWGADGGPFVGREHELEKLRGLLAEAYAGRGRLVLLTGEPGVGKTRIAAELARLASALGAQVLWGRCYEREGAPPYWPWLQAIRPYVATCRPDRLRLELGPGAGAIADVLPEVRDRLGEVESPRGAPDERQARFRLLDAIASFLRRAAQREPLVLVLEDLHGADAASLALLDFVARELETTRLLVVGMYRDVEIARGHPLRQTLAELARDRLYERLALGGLPPEDVASFMGTALGEDPSPSLVAAVHDRTGGNPLFMTEVVRILVQEGRRDWDGGVPEGVREVIGLRLDKLSPQCNEALRVASVIGREFGLDQLGPLVDGCTDEELLAAVEEALAARLLTEAPGSPGRFRFAHPLIRETLEAELSSARRVRLHGRIAATLEELYGASAAARAAELAYHFAEAETVTGPEKVVHYCRLAGEQAYAAHAYDDAIRHFQRALAAREGAPMDDDTAELVFALVRSEFLGRDRLDLEGAVERMRRAFDYHLSVGHEQRAVDIAAHPIPPVWGPTELPDLLRRSLELTEPDSLDAGRILANIGRFAGTNDGNYDAAQEAFDRALAIARIHGDRALERRVLTLAARVDWWFRRWESCTEKSRLALELALAAGDEQNEMYARAWLTRDAATRGDLPAARAEAAASLELAERLRERYWLATARLNSFWIAALGGDWIAARSLSNAGLATQPHDPRNLAVRALLEHELGDPEAGDAYLGRLLESMRAVSADATVEHSAAASALGLVGRLTGREDDLAEAGAAGERVLRAPTRIPIFDLQARVGLGAVAIARGDAPAAAEHYRALEAYRGTLLVTLVLAADRLLGLLALTGGRVEEAFAHFESALVFCEHAGYRPELARTGIDYAAALRQRDARGDADRAVMLLDNALIASRELGMQGLEQSVAT